MRTRRISWDILFFIVTLFFLSSCDDKAIYDNAYVFEDRSWNSSDTAFFTLDISDTLTAYDLILTLRNSTDYAWSNLWVHIATTAPDSSVTKIAQRINIARPNGSWIGRVSGSIVESKLHYTTTQFPISGTYTFALVQATQSEQIDEVLDISLRVEPKMKD